MGDSTQPESQPNSGSITITCRTDLSLLYRVLRIVIRPLRPHLVTPKGEYPAGSPRLRKHPHRIGKVSITEREILIPSNLLLDSEASSGFKAESLWVYDFHLPVSGNNNNRATATHTVYYFAGGGFQAPASSEHWKFCAYLASSLPRSRVVLVSYPLAPHSPAKTTLPFLRRWLIQELRDAAAGDRVVSLVGDSSGANIALSLGLWCADQLALAKSGTGLELDYHRLKSVLAISPPTDLRSPLKGRAPSKAEADAQDPVLGPRIADAAATAWSADSEIERRNPYLSLILADLANLKASGIRVNGVVGTADVLAPDALEFVDRCGGEGVKGQWLVWNGLMHCFPLAACYGLREGVEGRDWIVRVLGGVA
ncbi:Alpha/Beta hydrolase protein [Annulohypoxylon truncatum]|uniref:Alpha/Beta hydrolase protein n=1 Tax=Annulohypoxylon truncatum TaxID=327061 RepID=UPI0020082521|nr:Alpha/Beta hydrolase protein [Annulohypoxylon truncatum]KAI1212012.1 Alpha/Beta hydrolase protein [Annulohypoxylon truncatum]